MHQPEVVQVIAPALAARDDVLDCRSAPRRGIEA
jgi:hypothetical protein